MMKFHLYVQQNQWLMVAVLTGGILVVLCWLTYRALWKPREEEARVGQMPIEGVTGFIRWLFEIVPWVVLLLIVGSIVYTITHLLAAATTVPNW